MKRVLTATLLIPAVLYLVFLAHPVLFLAAVVLVAGPLQILYQINGSASTFSLT